MSSHKTKSVVDAILIGIVALLVGNCSKQSETSISFSAIKQPNSGLFKTSANTGLESW